jgi:hypothetical protein
VPTPSDALITPGEACAPLAGARAPEVCAFGASPARAAATVALVGDSHSAHWRAALRVVARAKAWRVLSIYRSQCPFSMAGTRLPGRARAGCARWRRDTIRWFRRHRAVHTVFVSQRARTRVAGHSGSDQVATQVAGYTAAWRALPASVDHIIVIRDVPYSAHSTRRCIERAMANRRPAGPACARARDAALASDPAVDAAARLHSGRVQSIDLTPLMCDERRCYPVVGGVLVIKDIGHLTRLFSTTLGPFLLRTVNQLIAGW